MSIDNEKEGKSGLKLEGIKAEYFKMKSRIGREKARVTRVLKSEVKLYPSTKKRYENALVELKNIDIRHSELSKKPYNDSILYNEYEGLIARLLTVEDKLLNKTNNQKNTKEQGKSMGKTDKNSNKTADKKTVKNEKVVEKVNNNNVQKDEILKGISSLSTRIETLEKQHRIDTEDTKEEFSNVKVHIQGLQQDVIDLSSDKPEGEKKFTLSKVITTLILAGLIGYSINHSSKIDDLKEELQLTKSELLELKSQTNQKFNLIKTVDNSKSFSLSEVSNDEIDSVLLASFDRLRAKRIKEEQAQLKDDFKNAAIDSTDEFPVYGNTNARFSIYEISDLDCPYCKRYHPVVKAVVDNSEGKINQKWVHFPIEQLHPNSSMISLISQCVHDLDSNTMFWAFVDGYFKNQGDFNWVQSSLSGTFGISEDRLKACMTKSDESSAARKIAKDSQFASKYGVNGTPTSVIKDNKSGREQVINGAYGRADLEQVLKAFMADSYERDAEGLKDKQ